jgi:hypothetical protein
MCFAVLTRPAEAQLPTISAARAAVSVAATDGAVDRTVKYVAGGAALGAAAAIAGGALIHTLFPDTCAVGEMQPCGSPNFVRLGVLGAVAGAVAGAYMASRQRENVNGAALRVSSPPARDGLALRILFR